MFIIEGGRALNGKVSVGGAKNSVLPILAATVLNGGENIIHNCPDLKDVDSAIEILRHLGCRVKREGSTVTVDSSDIDRCDVPPELMSTMRSSVIFLGPILARCKKAMLTTPGGCELGPRPVDIHLMGLEKLGALVMTDGSYIECSAEKLAGEYIELPFPSVGATENIMLAATSAKGTTVIKGAAREPEVSDLAAFLRMSGAVISGEGTDEITVSGGELYGPAEYRIMPDRIETATFMLAAAAAGGDIEITDTRPTLVEPVVTALRYSGARVICRDSSVRVTAAEKMRCIPVIRTAPYPGFPTDALAPMMAACCTFEGTTVFYEEIFENRYRHVPGLVKMGADISVSGKMASVRGSRFHGESVECTDLRGGAALVIAALAAEGRSTIGNECHIDRGYDGIEKKLRELGADIKRV